MEVPVEIGVMDLPKDHSIVEIVAEGIPRQCTNLEQAVVDEEQFRLWFDDAAGAYLAIVWQPYERAEGIGPWNDLIDSVRSAGTRVSKEFVTG